MNIKTKFFGEMEIDEKGIINFERPLLAFETNNRFALIDGMNDLVFTFMQSLDEPDLCFLTIPPALVIEQYDIELSEDIVKILGLDSPDDVLLFNIVTVPENVEEMTVNLKAPIVVNIKNGKAAQEVLIDEKYEIRHRIKKVGA